jgi:oxygen-dependent protoporphyrinogen oxidase
MTGGGRTAVIGAGISGLAAAYWLGRAGHEVTVFESASRTGGTIVTEQSDGFLIDLGPNSTLETSETLKQLVRDLDIEDQKLYGNEISNNRYILKNGELVALPMSPPKFLRSKLFSTRAKLRLLREPFLKPSRGDDISLADLVRYRLGQEFLDYAINPFVSGVYAGDPERLSAPAAFPKLYALEQKYGSFIKGAIRGARERKKSKDVARDRARLFSFAGGMEVFPQALERALGGPVHLGSSVTAITPRDGGYIVAVDGGPLAGENAFDRVVLSVPADSLGSILEDVTPRRAARFSGIHYPPVAVVFTGFRTEDVKRDLDGFGFLVPAVEKRRILGSIWSSTVFPGRAPDGCCAITTFVGGTRQPDEVALDDDGLLNLVQEEIGDIVGLGGAPVLTRIKRWRRAIPQYSPGYGAIQKMFDEIEDEFPGLFFAGNFRSGISVGDSVVCAHNTVQKMLGTG